MKHVIVGTAGHIDHGKSALVAALTGTHPDRLEEEKRRGITIDIGFAFLNLGEIRIGFVDVPGHERFVRNMLAGAGGIDLVLLVVAADESAALTLSTPRTDDPLAGVIVPVAATPFVSVIAAVTVFVSGSSGGVSGFKYFCTTRGG